MGSKFPPKYSVCVSASLTQFLLSFYLSSIPYICVVLRKKKRKSWCKLICWQGYAAEESRSPSSSVCDSLFHNETQIPPRPTTILQGPFPTPYWTPPPPTSHSHTRAKTQIYADVYMRTHAMCALYTKGGSASLFSSMEYDCVCMCVTSDSVQTLNRWWHLVFFSPTMTTRLRVWRCLSGCVGVCRVRPDTCFCICIC